MSDPETEREMRGWFEYVRKYREKKVDKTEFVDWRDYVGHFGIATLHMTSAYFAYAREIELREPFRELDPAFSKELARQISVVKKAFGSKDGVWEYLQDAIGEIVSRKDTVMSYLQFCQGMTDLSDESNFGHFRRLVDFYFYILNPSKVTEIESALDSLEKFLAMNAVEHGIA
jgi:hypothetical protein